MTLSITVGNFIGTRGIPSHHDDVAKSEKWKTCDSDTSCTLIGSIEIMGRGYGSVKPCRGGHVSLGTIPYT